MTTRKRILLPRSDIPGRAPTINEIDFGEIAINTHDGKAFIKREANGEVSVQSIGSEEVENVYYVSKSGDYGNDGRSLINSFKTLDSAVAVVTAKQSFKFNELVCERDLNLIMDAVRYDMVLDTNYNTVTAGNAYKRGNAIKVTTDQKYQTRRAINEERVGMISAPEVVASPTATQRVSKGFTEIIDIFYDGDPDALYYTDPPIEVWADANAASNVIQDNRSAIQDDVIAFINSSFTETYDAVKCARDAGLIMDAVRRDLILGTDYNSITAGFAYKRANSAYVLSAQLTPTIQAVNFLRDQIKTLTGPASDSIIDSLILKVTQVLDGTITTYTTPTYVDTVGATYQTADRIAATNNIQTNRATIVSDLTTWISINYSSFSYDIAKCERDVGYILDALSHDVKYGGNTAARQNALAYFVGAVSQLGVGENVVTVQSYLQLKTLINAYVTTTPEQTNISDLLDIIITVISDEDLDSLPDETEIDTTGLVTTEFDSIYANRLAFQNDTIDFVNDMNPVSNFDDEKCFRDTGLIIDAVALDLQNNTNYNSATAGLAYRRGNAQKVQSDQLSYTVDSINYLRDQINASGISAISQTFVTARFKEITDLLTESTEYGAFDGDPLFYTGSGSENADKRNAINSLIVNRKNIQIELINWIQVNYDTLKYDQDKCNRDVGYIIDALAHDILYDGSFATDTNARSYWVGTDLNIEVGTANESLDGVADVWTNQLGAGEITASLAAYEQLKSIVNKYITTSAEETRVNTLIDVIRTSIAAADGTSITVTLPTITGDSNLFHVNRNILQEQVVFYANSIFPVYSYDQVKCRRDVGFILDGLSYDLKYGGNSATYTNQRSYFSIFSNGYGDLLGQNEITATISAYENLKSIIAGYTVGLNTDNINKVIDLLDIIINSVQQSSVGTYTLGEFFDGDAIYQYNVPTGSDPLAFPDLITLGHKVIYNDLYLAHQAFDVGASQRLTVIRSSNAVAKNQGTDSTIFLKSGDYIVNNPIKLPPKTAIIGDALRACTIRPKNVDSDIFWADNGVYIKEITFRDHQDGAAVLAFDPRVDSAKAGPFITQSPYVQNCTSLTSSGIGLRIDGSKVSGLRSMVLDAFTQFNAGGTGVHLLNRGYAQLVSLFTVSTTTSVLATSGGQCSLTNSNSSFGERGLVATGGSKSLYNGSVHANYIQNDEVIRINNIITQDSADYTLNLGDYKKPNYNDAIRFDSDNYYYTVLNVSDEITQDWATTGNTTENAQGVFNTTASFPQQTKTNNGLMGYSTHMSQDDLYLVITEINDAAGKAEIYTKDIVGGVPQWDYQAQVIPTPIAPAVVDANTNFGEVALLNETGDFLAVSAPAQQKVDATNATVENGAVYMYERTGSSWSQHSVVFLPGVTDRNRSFGRSMDLSEDGLTLIVSTDNDTGPATQGAVYYYLRTLDDPSTWVQQQRIIFPDGTGFSTTQPSVTISADGSDLIIQWGGAINKAYYYQRNIDNIFILAQQVFPRSNFVSQRTPMIRMNPTATHFVMGDTLTPRGYFTNINTDSDNSADFEFAKKQKLDNLIFSNSPAKITTSDTDRWINFENDFAVGTTIQLLGSTGNDGSYVISQVAQDSVQFSGTFPSTGAETDVQMYIDQVGVAEFFVFDEGQWVTEDIIEAPIDVDENFGFGSGVDINTRGELASVGNYVSDGQQRNEVSIIERARSDWRKVTQLQPLTPTNIAAKGSNDGYGSYERSTGSTVGGSGDFVVVGAAGRRETDTDAGTEYGAVYSYYSILEETGSYELTIAPALNKNFKSLQNASFHQRSLITASGHTFEYVGSGTNMFTAIPQNGGVPKKENEVIFDSAEAEFPNFGLVYFTATDELGDFRIGEDLTINREEGTITGVTFDRSLFAVLTPFILALEGS